MAQNSKNHSKTSRALSRNCPDAILNAVPDNCKLLQFSQLIIGESYSDKAIVGKVNHLYPIGKRATGSLRKLLITDALSTVPQEEMKNLIVFLLDKFAEDSVAAEVEGYIILSNFSVEKATRFKENELPVQILVKYRDSKVLFGRKIPPSASLPAENNKTTSQKKKKKPNNDQPSANLANNYEYVSLGDVKETESKMITNVYGIVEKCDLKVIQGKRTQILDLVLTDETDTGFICSTFAGKDETFPDVYPGDIIRIHRMQVYKFRSRLKGKCLSPKFMLVFSKSNQGTRPKSVAKSFTFTPQDEERVKELFKWSNKKSEPKLIGEIKKGDYINIVCQIIGVYCARTTEAIILKIWDGTKSNQIQSSHWGLKEEIIDEKLFMIAKNYYVVLHVYGPYSSSAAELRPGQFVEIQDAQLYNPKANPDDCVLCLHTGRKEGLGITVLDTDDNRVKLLKTRLDQIITDVMDIGNQTDDILSQNNSIFLNCDISQYVSGQTSGQNGPSNGNNDVDREEQIRPLNSQDDRTNSSENAAIEALNSPMNLKDGDLTSSQKTVISVLEAAVKPGQCTQEFGEGTQRDILDTDALENEVNSQLEPPLNKSPLELRMFLHNPPKGESPSVRPLSDETNEEWWKSVPTISETDGHSDIKPTSLSEIVKHSVPYKFRCLVAVLSYKPITPSMHELIHLYCPNCHYLTKDAMPSISPFEERDGLFYFYCPECSSSEKDKQNWPVLKYVYLISFELHDGSGDSKVEAHLWREEAVKFFRGITPEQALKDKEASNAVFRMLWSICPDCRPFNSKENSESSYTSYPILDCCILSYTSRSGTSYQLFDTKLL